MTDDATDRPRPFDRSPMFVGSRWWLEISGEATDLRALADLFTSSGLRVVADDQGQSWLGSDELNSLSEQDADVARARLEQLVVIANGALRLELPDFFEAVRAGRAMKSPGGTRLVLAARIWHSRDDRERLGMPANDGIMGKRVREWSEIARRDETAHELLRHLGRITLSWDDLFRAFEVVRDDVGGEPEIVRLGWASAGDVKKFKASANNPALSGELARHARAPGSAPGPRLRMSLEEGRWFVAGMAQEWLARRA